MEQKGSREAIKQNLSNIVETFKKIEAFHAELEEHSKNDEELLDDMIALSDIRLEVNNITGMVQDHLKERSGSRCCSKSQISSQRSSSPPPTLEDTVEYQEEFDKEVKKREIDQQLQQAVQLSELARQKRAEAAQLQEKAENAERQFVLPIEEELPGTEKAALYVKHVNQVRELKSDAEYHHNDRQEEEDWIAEFQKNRNVGPRVVDPGKLPVRAEVPVYHGDPLQWLSWSSLFKALVHDTRMTSEAEMGFLHTKLSKDCDQVIAGLFPDDEGYAEALMLLRDQNGW